MPADGAPCPRREPAFDDAAIDAAGERARAVWTVESGRERDRLLLLPAASRLAALDDDATRQALTAGHRAEVRASLAPAPAGTDGRQRTMTPWTVERRRLVLMHALRPLAAAGCVVAAIAPFLAGPWRWGWSFGEAVGAFLTIPRGLLGMALAVAGAGIAARMVPRVGTPEGLWWLVAASFVAGVAGLAVAGGAV